MTVGSPKRCAGWVLLSSVICLYVYVHPVEAVETVSCELLKIRARPMGLIAHMNIMFISLSN